MLRHFFIPARPILCVIVAMIGLAPVFAISATTLFGQTATTGSPSKIGIIGSGNIGGTLGTGVVLLAPS
jgi:hypothetical protein